MRGAGEGLRDPYHPNYPKQAGSTVPIQFNDLKPLGSGELQQAQSPGSIVKWRSKQFSLVPDRAIQFALLSILVSKGVCNPPPPSPFLCSWCICHKPEVDYGHSFKELNNNNNNKNSKHNRLPK